MYADDTHVTLRSDVDDLIENAHKELRKCFGMDAGE